MKSLSRVQPIATPWTAAYQAPPSMGFSRQEYWSGVPLPSLFFCLLLLLLSHFSRVRLCATPWIAAHQAPPSMGFSRQEYWSGVPLPSLFPISRIRTDAFKLWCWRRLLRVPWSAWRSNQSILKEINPEHSLEGPMLKLKLQYFGHLM